MAMKSKYNSICKLCGKDIRKDIDWIEPKPVSGYDRNQWVHVKCPASNQSALGTSVKTASNYKGQRFAQIIPSVNNPLSIEEAPIDNIGDSLADAIEDSLKQMEAPAIRSFTPSKFQQDIFDAITAMVNKVADFKHLVIEAVAGSGKTTTIEQSLKLIPIVFQVAFVAFNKHIASELDRRCKASGLSNVMALTLHSLGSKNLKNHFPRIKLEKDKVGHLMDDIYFIADDAIKAFIKADEQPLKDTLAEYIKTIGEVEYESHNDEKKASGLIQHIKKTNRAKRSMMRKLVAICKNTLIDATKRDDVMMAIDKYGIEIDAKYLEEIITNLPIIMQRCKDNISTMDFDDMLWLPVVLDLSLEKFDYLMVDEFQDMNKCQIEFILRSIRDDGHIIAVGDRYQSLYGFRGADTDAIPNAITRLNAKVLPLSVTYRCPTSHVELAQEIVPQIEARENAPEGTIIELDPLYLVEALQAGDPKNDVPGDMVICRTNAPLVAPAFECIRAGKKAMIRGLEVGDGLINLVKRFETDDLGRLQIALNEYKMIEYEKLMSWGKEMPAILLQDKVDTLLFIIEESNTLEDVISKIDMLFSDDNSGIVFSSVHRAKGLEAMKVYILKPELLPHPKAKKSWEQEQEMNCKYVALTRSKDTLVFVRGKKDEKR